MREDMFKVIVESPRGGISHARVNPIRAPKDDRNWMPVSRGRGTKWLNENLTPLYRFLRRSVGRPWNEVFSEICKNLSVRNPVQKHVRDHLKDLVELHVEVRDGELYAHRRRLPLRRGPREELYVCPHTGLLKVLLPLKRKTLPIRQSEVTWVRHDQVAFIFQDQWWLVTVRKISHYPVFDVMLQESFESTKPYPPWRLRKLYGRDYVVGIERRQLNKAEAKKLGLKRSRRRWVDPHPWT